MPLLEHKSTKLLFLLLPILVIGAIVYILIDYSIDNSDAIYKGKLEAGYPHVGYLQILYEDGQIGICGANIIDQDTIVTAAHCLIDNGYEALYIGTGEFDAYRIKDKVEYHDYRIEESYSENQFVINAGRGDIAVVKTNSPMTVSEYAQPAAPEIGCDYYLVGYGTNDDGIFSDSFARKGIDVCIDSTNDFRAIVSFPNDGNFCHGDSGSGIYYKNTNRLVALVSSYDGETCDTASAYFATRLDSNINFVFNDENVIPTVTPTPFGQEISPVPSPTPAFSIAEAETDSSSGEVELTDGQITDIIAVVMLLICCCIIFPAGTAGLVTVIIWQRRKSSQSASS